MINLPRSSYYYRSTARSFNLDDTELVAIIEDIQDELPCYAIAASHMSSTDGDISSIINVWRG